MEISSQKKKKELAKQVLNEVVNDYSFSESITTPLHELLGIPNIQEQKFISLDKMEHLIAEHQSNVIPFPIRGRGKYLRDPELRAIDKLLDNSIIDMLLAPPGFTPSMRTIFPSHLFRAELLKSLKYPEISYRKYCNRELNNLEHKTNRAFVGLSLRNNAFISHSQLSQFRTAITFTQMVNILVYIIHLFLKSGKLGSDAGVYAVDSSELPAICNPVPFATIKIGDKKVRIYTDLDADSGKRRKKRDKSEYFVGYRIHSLVAIHPHTGHNYPLISLIAPGNHHDNPFLPYLIALGKAIGLNIRLVTADEGYGDAEQNEIIRKEHDVTVITPPSNKVKLPEHVGEETNSVYMNKWCETPMIYRGKTDECTHEFTCNANQGECIHASTCHKYREIAVDSGTFGEIPAHVAGFEDAVNLRKHMERSYNLLKHREGLEPLRVRSQHGVMAAATFANIATILLEIVGTRKTTKEKHCQTLKAAA
ncbi:MAG: transposase [Planctomycetota bacterium]